MCRAHHTNLNTLLCLTNKMETNLNPGQFEEGVEHLTNGIAVCGQPQQLLQVLQQTLPPPVFQMLLTKLPTISQVRIFFFSPISK